MPLDANFVEEIRMLTDTSGQMAISVITPDVASRPWQVPVPVPMPAATPWLGDVFDLQGIIAPFDRTELDRLYALNLHTESPGTLADTAAIKVQADWVAMAERAFRTRHCSPIRAEMHAAARRTGHGNKLGPITNVQTYALTLLESSVGAL